MGHTRRILLGFAIAIGVAACLFLVTILVVGGLAQASLWAGVVAALAAVVAAVLPLVPDRSKPLPSAELKVTGGVVDRPADLAPAHERSHVVGEPLPVVAEPPGHAFICYVQEDASHVERLQRDLEAADISVWRDTDLWPGEDWRTKLRSAIADNALVFIACFSAQSTAREESCQDEELMLAIEELRTRRPGVPWLVPVRFDDCRIPELDIGDGRTLASLRRADLFGERYDDEASRLVTAVFRILRPDTAADRVSRLHDILGENLNG